MSFSARYGYKAVKPRLETVSNTIKQRVFATFYKQEFDCYDADDYSNYTTGIEDMMIEMGVPYVFPRNRTIKQQNAVDLQRYLTDAGEWYTIFDFMERYLSRLNNAKAEFVAKEFNRILQEEVSGYRVIDKQIVPITNALELETIKQARSSPYDSINIHISKSLSLFADRKVPDYENSIKESISAVESLCCIITEKSGKSATLGNTLKLLDEKGVHIHQAMQKAFSLLYGYTSDEDGIRHGGIDFKNAPSEDAKFMLVTCSAFINYLLEKWSKVKS